MEPRSIEPQDIRVGDRVRLEDHLGDDVRTVEFTVSDRDGDMLYSASARYGAGDSGTHTWTLLDRPEPDRLVGPHWRDPETGAEYVRTDGRGAAAYWRYRHGENAPHRLIDGRDDRIIARLVPIPAFDPATLWPYAEPHIAVCTESFEGWSCSRGAGHDGMHAAYVGSNPDDIRRVWGDPR